MKGAIIGRHSLLPSQQKALESLQVKIVKQIPQVPTDQKALEQFIHELKSQGIEALIIQALPIDLLAKLLPHFTIYFMKMQAVATVESEEEAKKIIEQAPDKRVAIPAPNRDKKTFRIMEFIGITKIKKIVVEEEFVVRV